MYYFNYNMIIRYNKIGFEDLTGFSYIYKRDVFRKNNLYYKYVKACSECDNSFFMRLTYPTNFCSPKCASSSKIVRNKISKTLSGHKRTKEECEIISKRMSKGGVVAKNLPLYATYARQIIHIEEVRDNEGFIEVRCSVCNEWFTPKRTNVEQRVQYIKGNTDRENRFYCSKMCKEHCPIFNKQKYPEGYNPRAYRNRNKFYAEAELLVWSKEVLSRADYECEICGLKAEHAHHIQPKKLEPGLALDPENGLAVCKECHYKYGHVDECSSAILSKIKC